MTTILLGILGAVAGWFAGQRGLVKLAPPTAAIAGGVGALVGGAVLNLLFTALGLIIGAALGVAVALVLAQTAFKR